MHLTCYLFLLPRFYTAGVTEAERTFSDKSYFSAYSATKLLYHKWIKSQAKFYGALKIFDDVVASR